MHGVWCLLCFFPRLFLLGWTWQCWPKGPVSLTEQISPLYRCMCGTNQKAPRCVALTGTPDKNAYCSVYKNRPSTCRGFAMSDENDNLNEACNRTREKYELPEIWKISIKEKNGRNTIDVTVSANFPVAVFIMHTSMVIYLDPSKCFRWYSFGRGPVNGPFFYHFSSQLTLYVSCVCSCKEITQYPITRRSPSR